MTAENKHLLPGLTAERQRHLAERVHYKPGNAPICAATAKGFYLGRELTEAPVRAGADAAFKLPSLHMGKLVLRGKTV